MLIKRKPIRAARNWSRLSVKTGRDLAMMIEDCTAVESQDQEYIPLQMTLRHANKKATPSVKEADDAQERSTTDVAPCGTDDGVATPQKGVIRNLLAGHYKGVADVRLRMNFMEELSAVQEVAVARAVDDFEGQIGAVVGDLGPLAALEDELNEDGADQKNEAGRLLESLTDILNPEPASRREVLSLIEVARAAFADLVASIPPDEPQSEETSATGEDDNLAPNSGEEGAVTDTATDVPTQTIPDSDGQMQQILPDPDTIAPEDSAEEEDSGYTATLDSFLAEWNESLPAMLDELASRIQESVPGLEPQGEPSGNGVAYEKFLAAYQSMLDGPESDGDS